jgi:hypothetical protein
VFGLDLFGDELLLAELPESAPHAEEPPQADPTCWPVDLLEGEPPAADLLKASRPLIQVLVINDNGLWINNFF